MIHVTKTGIQCCCVVPVDDLCGKGEGSKVKNEDVASLRTDIEVSVDLREAALGYRLAPGGKKRYIHKYMYVSTGPLGKNNN